MRPHSHNDLIALRCNELRSHRASLLNRINTLSPPEETDQSLEETTRACEAEIKHSAEVACVMLLNVLFKARTVACRELRYFRLINEIHHTAASPVIINTLLIIGPLMSIEGIAMGITMMANGDLNPVPAVGYGLVFSAVNVALAVSAGFFCTRYLTYRVHSKYPEARDEKIRKLARYGLAAHLGILALLVFSTLRVRATGSHEGIFHFGEVGFLATFDNGFTLAILGISFLSTVIGVYEGRKGFSDIVPEYTEVQRRAEIIIDDQAEALVDDTMESLEDHAQSAGDDVLDRVEEREESLNGFNDALNAIHGEIVQYNNQVLSAKDEARVYAVEQSEIDALPPCTSKLDAFDALLLTTEILPQTLDTGHPLSGDALVGRLNRARSEASAQVLAAHAEFLTRKPELEIPEHGDFAQNDPSHDQSHRQSHTIGGSHHA